MEKNPYRNEKSDICFTKSLKLFQQFLLNVPLKSLKLISRTLLSKIYLTKVSA